MLSAVSAFTTPLNTRGLPVERASSAAPELSTTVRLELMVNPPRKVLIPEPETKMLFSGDAGASPSAPSEAGRSMKAYAPSKYVEPCALLAELRRTVVLAALA